MRGGPALSEKHLSRRLPVRCLAPLLAGANLAQLSWSDPSLTETKATRLGGSNRDGNFQGYPLRALCSRVRKSLLEDFPELGKFFEIPLGGTVPNSGKLGVGALGGGMLGVGVFSCCPKPCWICKPAMLDLLASALQSGPPQSRGRANRHFWNAGLLETSISPFL